MTCQKYEHGQEALMPLTLLPTAIGPDDLDYITALGPVALNEGPIPQVQQAWEQCLQGHLERPAGVRQVIWASWRRSVEAGLDPQDAAYRFVSPEALAAKLSANRQPPTDRHRRTDHGRAAGL
jgi:sigma-54 dependent transcriptional regulator, acetoin dehydrogenase operon transcriptional activator AcoR